MKSLLPLLAPALGLFALAQPLATATAASTTSAGTDTLTLLPSIVTESAPPAGAFTVFDATRSAPLWHDAAEFTGVIRALGDLRTDIERVGGRAPEIATTPAAGARPVIVGTLGKNALIDGLVAEGRLDASDLAGKWESFVITVVEKPAPGVDQALVIAGSDKRGTIYGIYELSEQLGVSPHPGLQREAHRPRRRTHLRRRGSLRHWLRCLHRRRHSVWRLVVQRRQRLRRSSGYQLSA